MTYIVLFRRSGEVEFTLRTEKGKGSLTTPQELKHLLNSHRRKKELYGIFPLD